MPQQVLHVSFSTGLAKLALGLDALVAVAAGAAEGNVSCHITFSRCASPMLDRDRQGQNEAVCREERSIYRVTDRYVEAVPVLD